MIIKISIHPALIFVVVEDLPENLIFVDLEAPRTASSKTALLSSCDESNVEVVQLLLECGVSLNVMPFILLPWRGTLNAYDIF